MASMSTLGAILPASFMAVVIAVIVFVVVRIRSGEPVLLSFRSLFTAYFYLMSFVSFIILALGLSILLKAGFGGTLGRDFSYPLPPKIAMEAPRPVEVAEGGPQVSPAVKGKGTTTEERLEQERKRIETDYQNDIIKGATATVVGGLVWIAHVLGRRRVEDPQDPASNFFSRTYLTLLLAVFAIAGMIALVIGLYDVLRFYLLPQVEESIYYMRPAPGSNLAAAIVFVPIWIYYVLAFIRQTGAEGS